jgi:hypothetical protein
VKNNLKQGDLVIITRKSGWTLCRSKKGDWFSGLKECPCADYEIYSHPDHQDVYDHLENKIGLLHTIIFNRLGQPTGYRILIDGQAYFCKSITADKYLERKN